MLDQHLCVCVPIHSMCKLEREQADTYFSSYSIVGLYVVVKSRVQAFLAVPIVSAVVSHVAIKLVAKWLYACSSMVVDSFMRTIML